MRDAFLCDAIRTPIGRYGGALAGVRTDDLAALPIRALLQRHPALDPAAVDDVVYGCANQAGEDNRNVARMALLLAGLPVEVTGTTVNRLCGSGMDAVGIAARAIASGELDLIIAGGVESMSRAPFVMGKADCGLQPRGEDLRHDHRLALRQPAARAAVRRRLDDGDGRERGRGVPGLARGPGPLRRLEPGQGRSGEDRGKARRGDRSRHPAAPQAGPGGGRHRRAPTAGNDGRGAREAAAAGP